MEPFGKFELHSFSKILISFKLEDGLVYASINADVFAISTPSVTLTFDLQNLIRSSVGASEYSVWFIETAQAVHEISW